MITPLDTRTRYIAAVSLTEFALCRESLTNYAARNATKSKGTASLKLDSDPLGSPVRE